MKADLIISYDINNLTEVEFTDNSVYDVSTTLPEINAVRFRFGSVNSLNQVTTGITNTDTVAFKEYEVTSGTLNVQGRTFNIGDVFCLSQSITIPSNVIIAETGYFIPYTDYLPSDANPDTFTPSQTGLFEGDVVFTDNVFDLTYTLFKQKFAIGSITLSTPTKFIVTGTQGNYITIGSEEYYVGEVFTKSANFTFANGSGTNFIVKYETEAQIYFRTWGENWNVWVDYMNEISTSYQVSQRLLADYLKVTANIQACAMYEEQQFGVSPSYIQTLLDQTNNIYPLRAS